MRNLIIDCDPGHDDIMAILLGLKDPELNILGFTTVCGNNLVNAVTDNLCRVMTFADVDLTVCKGADRPLVYEPDPQSAHGSTGLDGPDLPENTIILDSRTPEDFYKDMILKYGTISIAALAPLTNIALFMDKYPELVSNIDCLSIMGGSRNGGNIQKHSEFNIYGDPHAAKMVFDSNIPIVLADLEACNSASVPLADLESFKGKGRMQAMVYDMMYYYCGYSRDRNRPETPIFDVLPVMWFNHPDIFNTETCKVDIVTEDDGEHRGQTIMTYGNGNVRLLNCIDKNKFKDILFEAIRKWDEDEK